jgi:hypothetical protein
MVELCSNVEIKTKFDLLMFGVKLTNLGCCKGHCGVVLTHNLRSKSYMFGYHIDKVEY